MNRSGLISILLLALVAAMVLLTISRQSEDSAALWERWGGASVDTTAEETDPASRTPRGAQGTQQIDRMEQDMRRMNELMDSVRR